MKSILSMEEEEVNLTPEKRHAREKEKKSKWKGIVQRHMEEAFAREASALDAMMQRGDTTGYWHKWGECVETAYINARGLDQREAASVRGRGQVLFETVNSHDEITHMKQPEETEWTQMRKRLIQEPQKAIWMIHHLKNLARQRGAKQQQQPNACLGWSQEMKDLWRAIKRKHGELLNQDCRRRLDEEPNATTCQLLLEHEVEVQKKNCSWNNGGWPRKRQKDLRKSLTVARHPTRKLTD